MWNTYVCFIITEAKFLLTIDWSVVDRYITFNIKAGSIGPGTNRNCQMPKCITLNGEKNLNIIYTELSELIHHKRDFCLDTLLGKYSGDIFYFSI